ncbi:hypothetical protein NL676_032797 [Syzygium grande]|nr:hypothetical protein NL676_032797 [Syzygium grande]
MARDHKSVGLSFRCLCSIIFILSGFSIASFLCWFHCTCTSPCHKQTQIPGRYEDRPIDLLTFASAWNDLDFTLGWPPKLLKIAVFVKKWPHRSHAGGLERHASTLHLALAKRGHELHIFTTSPTNSSFPKYPISSLYFHLSKPTAAGCLDQALVWKQFQSQNSTGRPFDVIHTESVGLMHTRSRNITNLAVSWHGIAYETIHSDVIQELVRSPDEPRSYSLTESDEGGRRGEVFSELRSPRRHQ